MLADTPEQFDASGIVSDEEVIDVEDEASSVATSSRKNLVVLFVGLIVAAGVLYTVFFGGEEEKDTETEEVQIAAEGIEMVTQEEGPVELATGVISTPDIPDIEVVATDLSTPSRAGQGIPAPVVGQFPSFPPPISIPELPEPEEPELPEPEISEDNDAPGLNPPGMQPGVMMPGQEIVVTPESKKAKSARRKSGLMVLNGGGVDPVDTASFGGSNIPLTAAEQATATIVGDTSNTIVQGKIIDAVLETAINTDLPGVLRALVSRDIYAESGKNILLPKGSRLIGNYDSNITRGQRRVYVVWTRVVRPDGIDIELNSPGTDQLGRAGVTGVVDNRYFEIFGNSILLSAVTIAGAIALSDATDTGSVSSSTTTAADGASTSTESGGPVDLAIADSVTELGDVASDIAGDLIATQPTISVAQGTRIKVFVNRDLVFPPSFSDGFVFVP